MPSPTKPSTRSIKAPATIRVYGQQPSGEHAPELDPTVSRLAGSMLELLVYANCPLEHRVGLLALIANGLEHACSQRIELALDGGLGP